MTTDRNKQIDQIARNCESLSEKDRVSVVRLLEEGFHDQAACALFDEGIAEERVSGTCPDPSAGSNLRFIPSALQDLQAFVTSTGKSRLRAALLNIRTALIEVLDIVGEGRNGIRGGYAGYGYQSV